MLCVKGSDFKLTSFDRTVRSSLLITFIQVESIFFLLNSNSIKIAINAFKLPPSPNYYFYIVKIKSEIGNRFHIQFSSTGSFFYPFSILRLMSNQRNNGEDKQDVNGRREENRKQQKEICLHLSIKRKNVGYWNSFHLFYGFCAKVARKNGEHKIMFCCFAVFSQPHNAHFIRQSFF